MCRCAWTRSLYLLVMLAVVWCTSTLSWATISFSNNTLTYSSPSDLATTIDPSGQKEVANSYGVTKSSFQALSPKVVAFNGAPAASQTLRTLVVNYATSSTVTFTFPAAMYNYGSMTSVGRGSFSGSAAQDAISTVPVQNGSLYDWFDASITSTGGQGVQSLGFCAAFRNDQAVAAGQVLYTLSDASTETVTLPALGGSGNPEYVFIGYTAPSGKTITRVQASRTSGAGGGYVSVDDLSFVMSPDTTAPAAVANLATSSPTASSVTLSWTAPGDDDSTGTAASYDIRYSPSTINDANWSSATQVAGEPTPAAAGTAQNMTVSGLSADTTYYFAMKTLDEVPNTSALSNVPSRKTGDATAPVAIVDLATSSPTTSSITLTWTAPGDNGSTGTAAIYDIRYRTGGVIDDTNWASATQVTGEPTPATAGTNQNMTVSGLSAGTTYYFAIKSSDEVPNTSAISNSPSGTTGGGGGGTGLKGDYYNNMDFTSFVLTRTDATVDFTWDAGSPAPAIDVDTFSVRWTGQVQAQYTETYTFYTVSDDGVRLWVNGQQLVDSWVDQAPTEHSGQLALTAGQKYNITMEYYEDGYGATARLLWSSPSTTKQAIPQSRLYPAAGGSDTTAPAAVTNLATSTPTSSSITLTWTAPGDDGSTGTATSYDIRYSTSTINDTNWASATQVSGEPTPAAAGTNQSVIVSGLSSGTTYYFAIKTSDEVPNTSSLSNVAGGTTSSASGVGLKGDYYNNIDFTSLVTTRTDATVNFSWGAGSPATGVDVDTFSVRWTGQVQAQYTETYTFYTTSDDGARLWVNGQQIINSWTDQAPTEHSGTIALTAGQKYDITLEYYDNASGATIILSWSSPSTAKAVIPQSQLFLPAGGDATAPAAVSNLATSNPTTNSLTLTWTAPGDDGSSGTATSYDIRYRTGGAVNDSNWASATPVTGEPTPTAAGTNQSMVVSGLSANTTYYFAIKTSDEVPNTSGISNSPSGTTAAADTTAPAAVTNLAVSTTTATSATLTWTAPGDDGSTGTATSYDIRYRTGGAVNDSNWASATQVSAEPAPALAGTNQNMVVGGLAPSMTYYFAIKTSDEVPNTSTISNSPSGTTQQGPPEANKAILRPRDFKYKGYYVVQTGGSFGELNYGQGFTHRYVNGQLRFLTTGFFGNTTPGGWQLVEFVPPASYGGNATFSNHWIDMWGDTMVVNKQCWIGLWYEQAQNRLWTTWAIDYPGDDEGLWTKSIVIRTLNDNGTISNAHGPYGLQDINNRRIYGGIQAIPQWFQNYYQVGPYATGWGGYASRMGYGASIGPTCYAIPEPTGYPTGNDGIPTTAFKTMMDHISGTRDGDWYAGGEPTSFDRGVRNIDYDNDYESTWQSPAPDGLGRWVWGDSNYNTGCWIETATKQGFVTVPKLSSGRAWYEWARLNCERQTAEIQVYNPNMLGEVAQGTRAAWNTYPTYRWQITDDLKPLGLMYGIPGNSPQAGPAGASYDSTTQTLYVYCIWGANSNSYVLCYEVGNGNATVNDVAVAETAVTGTATGTRGNTETKDNVYESIQEVVTGGTSQLERKWTFNVTAGSSVVFNLKSYKTSNSEGDDFVFAYSTNGSTWTNMVTVSRTTDDGTFQTYTLPGGTSGTVYVRVQDTDRTAGRNNLDTVYIDQMFFQSNP